MNRIEVQSPQGDVQEGKRLNESRYVHNHCRAIKEALACNKMEIDWKERGLGPSGPGPPARWHVVVQSSYDVHVTLEGIHIPKAMGFSSSCAAEEMG